MSYLERIAQIQSRAEASKAQARDFQNSVRQGAFETEEAKKQDYLGHIARGIEDIKGKFETAGAIAAGTGALTKSIKKVRELYKGKPKAQTDERETSTPREGEESSSPAGSERISTEASESEVPTSTTTEGAAPVEPPAGSDLPEPGETIELQEMGPGTQEEAPEARVAETSTEEAPTASDSLLSSDVLEGGGSVLAARTERAPEASEVPIHENLSTESRVTTTQEGRAPESTITTEEGTTAEDAANAARQAATETATTGATEASGGVLDAALGAVPIIGDVALLGSLIGDVIESVRGSKKEEEAEKTMEPEPGRGVAIATSGIDQKSLLEQ
jgi:hypothetical protein